MSNILHLTDIHLGSDRDDFALGDYGKLKVLEQAEWNSLHKQLGPTLTAIHKYLSGKKEKLDAVVISGDLTVQNKEEGFKKLEDLLAKLSGSRPANSRILVVPGNHDVEWKTPHSSPERYANFIRYVRDKGYTTPPLDGVDESRFSGPTDEDLAKFYIAADDGRWVILPINSSNFCGSLAALGDVAADALEMVIKKAVTAETFDAVKKEIEMLQLHDVSRISSWQMTSLRTILESARSRFPFATIVAVQHHHLLPVTSSEEFKSFESITNLASLRLFFRNEQIDVVLHGHKHVGFTYRDHIYDFEKPGPPHRLLVISGNTMGGGGFKKDEVARLVRVENNSLATTIAVAKIKLMEPADHEIGDLDWKRWRMWGPDDFQKPDNCESTAIQGETIDHIYSRASDLFRDTDRVYNLVLQLSNANSALTLPRDYPAVDHVDPADRQTWFTGLVDWWQRKHSSLSRDIYFTHGSRIYDYDGGNIDQISRIVDELDSNAKSGRAIAVLMCPTTDDITEGRPLPSFCSIQFIVRQMPGAQRLDCTAYFRHHELCYWLPVNLAELAKLQLDVVEKLIKKKSFGEDSQSLLPGAITVLSAIASWGQSPNRLVIPSIDRLFDEKVQELWMMIYAAFASLPQKPALLASWNRIIDDLIPPEDLPERLYIPADGLAYLVTTGNPFRECHPGSNGAALVDLLDELSDNISSLTREMKNRKDLTNPEATYRSARKKVVKKICNVKEVLDKVFNPPTSTSGSEQ